jgi:hypothetical protein
LRDVAPQQVLARGGADGMFLLANSELFLHCAESALRWSADSTRLELSLPANALRLRADGRDLRWEDGEAAFATALHLDAPGVTLVAKAGALQIRGAQGEIAGGRGIGRRAGLSPRQGWLLSISIGVLVAVAFLQWRVARRRPAAAPR